MIRSISIPYVSTGLAEYNFTLNYEISNEGDLQTLSCAIETGTVLPSWLQLKKFKILSKRVNGRYQVLYSEHNHSVNLECSLFIDKSYADIMTKEKTSVHGMSALS